MDESLIILRCAAPARVLRRGGCAASRLRAPGARARARARRDAQAGGRRRGELSSGNFLGWRATWSPLPPTGAPLQGAALSPSRVLTVAPLLCWRRPCVPGPSGGVSPQRRGHPCDRLLRLQHSYVQQGAEGAQSAQPNRIQGLLYRISYRSLGRNCWQARARDALTGRLARVWRASPSRLDATSGVSAGQAEEGTLQSKNSTLVHEDSITPLHTARRTAAHRCADTRANRAVVSCQIGAKKARKLKAKGAGGISQGPSID